MQKKCIRASLLLCIGLLSCTSPNSDENNSFLEKDHDFIAGVMCPNEDRDYAHEVFVGRIIPNIDAPPVVLGKDEVLNRVLLTMRQWYQAEIKGNTKAKVFIKDEQGNSVELQHTGGGLYRNMNNELAIKALRVYYLTVQYNGTKTYHGETTIPGEFEITNVSEGDTIAMPKSDDRFYETLLRVTWTPSKSCFFYRAVKQRDYFDFLTIDHSFRNSDTYISVPFKGLKLSTPEFNLNIEAIDTSYGRIYRAEDDFTFAEDWEAWFMKNNEKQIDERSNITGNGDVAGVFGSFNREKVHFWAVPAEEDSTGGGN